MKKVFKKIEKMSNGKVKGEKPYLNLRCDPRQLNNESIGNVPCISSTGRSTRRQHRKQRCYFPKGCLARNLAARCRIATGNAKTYIRHNDTSIELVRRERREGETPMRL